MRQRVYYLAIKEIAEEKKCQIHLLQRGDDFIHSSCNPKSLQQDAEDIYDFGVIDLDIPPKKISTFYIYETRGNRIRVYEIYNFKTSEDKMTDATKLEFKDTKQLKDFLALRWGPVWVEPSEELIKVYPAMKDVVGMIIRDPTDTTLTFKVDWTSSISWEKEKGQTLSYPGFFYFDQLKILSPSGSASYSTVHHRVGKCIEFTPISVLRGHIVAIDYHKWHAWLNGNAKHYNDAIISKIAECHQYLGQVIDIQTNYVKVSFCRGEKNCLITHVPKEVLLRVTAAVSEIYHDKIGNVHDTQTSVYEGLVPPKQSRTTGFASVGSHIGASKENPKYEKEKFEKGQIVLVNSNQAGEYNGLIGIVLGWTDVPHPAFNHEFEKRYKVDLDILPNRNLMMSTHAPSVDISQPVELKANPLDAYDPDLSWIPYWKVYQDNKDKKHVFVCKHGFVGKIDTNIDPQNRDITKGYKYRVEFQRDAGKVSLQLTDRELDIDYCKKKLLAVLQSAKEIKIGIENDDRNKNEARTVAFLYIVSDGGTRIEYSIMLGTLRTKRKHRRRFDESFEKGEINSPFQLQRYLIPESKGNFYALIKSDEFTPMESAIETS